MMVTATVVEPAIAGVSFRFVRHTVGNETVFCDLDEERAELADIQTRSASFGTQFIAGSDEVVIRLSGGTGA